MDSGLIKILLIGPCPPPLGGTTVLFGELASSLVKDDSIRLQIVDSNLSRYKNKFIRICMGGVRALKIITYLPVIDVVGLHTTNTQLLLSAYVISRLCRIAGKPLIIRKFGGPDHKRRLPDYNIINLSYAEKVRNVLRRVDMYLAESRESVEIAKGDGINNVAWYPNNKRMNEALVAKRTKCRKFIYVGHVKPTKGLREIIIAGKQIPDDCLIDVYGPLLDGMSEADFIGVERVHYKGILSPFDVVRMMNEYDALLLPTYHGGEGYPGVILEAYAAGIPVVASRWQVIPELVDETSGILTEPKNATSLLEAMMILVNRQEHYIKLCHGVVLKRGEFDACKWLLEYINLCQEVLKKKRK